MGSVFNFSLRFRSINGVSINFGEYFTKCSLIQETEIGFLSFTASPTTVTSLGQTVALAISTDDDLGIVQYDFFASPPQGVFKYNSNTQTASIQIASTANTISLDWIAESVLHGAPYDQKITVIVTDTDSETATAEIILPTNIP